MVKWRINKLSLGTLAVGQAELTVAAEAVAAVAIVRLAEDAYC